MADPENEKPEEGIEDEPEADAEGASEEGDGETEEGGDKPKPSKKRLLALAAIPVILILLATGAYFGGVFSTKEKDEGAKAEKASERVSNKSTKETLDDGVKLVIELDEFIANLRVNGSQPRFVKLKMALQYVGSNNTLILQKSMPVIRDRIITYLRELRVEDMQGAEGMYRVKSELLVRLNKLLYPVPIQDIYFKEILVQ